MLTFFWFISFMVWITEGNWVPFAVVTGLMAVIIVVSSLGSQENEK